MEDGAGVSGMQPALVGSDILAGDPARLLRVVLHGPAATLPADRPKFANIMPPMGFLPDDDLAAAITHARASFTSNPAPITAAQVTAARQPNP